MSLLEIAWRLWRGCGSRYSSRAEGKKLRVLSRRVVFVPVNWRLFFFLFWCRGANSRTDITNTKFIVEKENDKTPRLVCVRSSSYKLVCHYVSALCEVGFPCRRRSQTWNVLLQNLLLLEHNLVTNLPLGKPSKPCQYFCLGAKMYFSTPNDRNYI